MELTEGMLIKTENDIYFRIIKVGNELVAETVDNKVQISLDLLNNFIIIGTDKIIEG